MGMEYTERIIHNVKESEPLRHDVHREPRDSARKESNNYRTPGGDYTGSRGDCYKTANHALYSTNDRRLIVGDHIPQCPDEQTHRCGDVGVEDCCTGIGTRGVRIATVESIPANPQNTYID